MRKTTLPLAISGLVLVALVLSLALPAVGGAAVSSAPAVSNMPQVTTAPTGNPRLESAQRQLLAQRAREQGAAFANERESQIEAPHGQEEMSKLNGTASQRGQLAPAGIAASYVPDQVIVKFKQEAADFARASLNEDLGTSLIYTSPYAGFSVLQVPAGKTVADMVQAYSAQPMVEIGRAHV